MVKYKQRLAFRPGEEPAEMLRGIWTPTMGEWKEIIEDFVSTAKRRQNNKLAMFRLQMSIFSDIVVLEGSISQYTKLLNHPEEARKWIPEPEPINQTHLDTWKGELNSKKLIVSALRDIGDSVAWRVLQYNRPLLYMMTFNKPGGPLRMDIGRGNELYELADIVNDPTITHFFLHDVTNFARIGDITSVEDTGIVEFAEVKSKANPRGNKWKERVERQVLRLDNLTKIANEGIGLADDQGIVVKMINSTPKTSLHQIRAAVNEAQSSGIASRIIHPYLSMTVCDFKKNLRKKILNIWSMLQERLSNKKGTFYSHSILWTILNSIPTELRFPYIHLNQVP